MENGRTKLVAYSLIFLVVVVLFTVTFLHTINTGQCEMKKQSAEQSLKALQDLSAVTSPEAKKLLQDQAWRMQSDQESRQAVDEGR